MQEKAQHDKLSKIVIGNSDSETKLQLQKRKLKRVTESVLVAAQYQAVRINWIKDKIDKNQVDSQCRL